MGTAKKIYHIFNPKQRVQFFINLILAIVAGLMELISISAMLPLVNVILDEEAMRDNKYYSMFANIFGVTNPKDFAIYFALMLIFVYVIKNVYLMLRFKIQLDYVNRTKKAMTMNLLNCYLNQDYLFHVEHGAPELQRNVNNDVANFMDVVSAIMSISVEMFSCTFLLIFLFVNDPMTTVLLFAIFGCVYFAIFKLYRTQQVRAGKQARAASGEMNKWLIQSFGGIKEIKVLNRENFFYKKYSTAFDKAISIQQKYKMYIFFPKYITEMVAILGLMVTIIIRLNMNVDLKTFAATLSAFALAAMRMIPAFNRITEYTGSIMYGRASVNAVYEDLERASKLHINDYNDNHRCILKFDNEIVIKNLQFTYPEGDKSVFTGANLVIKKNQSIGLIGESGAGKTTLADIMLGLLKPNSGTVTVDGVDIQSDDRAWHRIVGYIPQMIYLIDDTIRANVVFGTEVDDERVWEALRDAQLEDFVKGLGKGLDTVVGDRGVKLSGGQRQRIGIARALYNKPAVLFLDEATSALDTETENAVMDSINYLQGKTTLVIIAHRLSTIRNCDRIYEVGHGVVTLRDKESVFKEESQKMEA